MSYRIGQDEQADAAVRRIASEQLEQAKGQLLSSDIRTGVHEARKRIKKVRALLRLVRDELGERYARENERLRDAARAVAPLRDASAVLESLKLLDDGDERRALADRLDAERRELEQSADAEDAVAQCLSLLNESEASIASWRFAAALPPSGWKAIYKRARKRLGEAEEKPTAVRLHEWRKRVKDHRYHCDLLRDAWRGPLEERESQTHDLTDMLGEHHDLLVLTETAERLGVESKRAWKRIQKRQTALEEQALSLGAKLFAEKPKRIDRRVKDYWAAASSGPSR